MKKKMIFATFFFLIGVAASGTAYHFTGNRTAFSVAIAFGTTFYHFAMRLAVGLLIDRKYHNHMDYTRKWFAERAFEQKLYSLIQVKKWKKRLPTFTPQEFSFKGHSVDEIIQVTCQAEVVHEVNMLLSFVPVVSAIWFGSLDVFILTSCVAFLFDGIFVIVQRYNRPRLLRLLRK